MEIPPQLSGGPAEVDVAGGTVRALSKVIGAPSEIGQGRRRDGSTFWMEVAFSVVPVGDRRLITGIFRDVTRRVEDEERIRHMNELLDARVRLRTAELQDAKGKLEAALQSAQAASQAKDVFVRTISHELRTPLSAVKGFTELLLNPKATKLRENPIPTLQKIHSASEYLLTLINDLLDVARYTAGEQIHLTLAEFDLPRFFSGIVEMTNPLVKKNGNQLAAESAGNLGRMRADETRVRQILLNLLSNAGKFTENGTITFKAQREQTPGGDQIVFTVADTGDGMTPEQMQGLFKPFYRVDNSITRKHGGTGLGLSISKLLCERMGGTISVSSEPGKGTMFIVRLPAAVPESAESVPPAAVKPTPAYQTPAPDSGPLQRDTVLVIDDDAMSREMVQSFLTREGFRVHLAATGEDGLRQAREVRPAAITLDVMMPDSDGWAVLSALKSDPHTRDIPVIMLTVAEDRSRGFTLGASDYVTKPIDWNRLGEILRKYSAVPASILVVEDDQLQRESLSQALTLSGWAVREAGDGREALRLVDAERPAVILLDLLMPNMDGFQFLDELRHRPGDDTIPVIVVTAKDLDDEDRRRLCGGVAQILHKGSVSREELLARIHEEVCSHIPRSVSCPTDVPPTEISGG
jgi:signal transduction histidine kinase/DNA-binding response OmpR family regulator